MNLHAYPSFFTHESRMLRETRSLAEGGFFKEIIIGAIWKPGLKVMERIDDSRTVFRVPLWSMGSLEGLLGKLVKLTEWELRLFLKYWKKRISVFNAHSLIVLPLGLLFKAITGCILVYDAHELETEVNVGRLQRLAYKLLEKLLISKVDITVTVSESIGDWYRKAYGIEKVYVIRNIPDKPPKKVVGSRVLRDCFQIDDDHVLFIYQGSLERGRGIELILETFLEADANKHIIFMGMGSLSKQIRLCADKYSNIHFHEVVPPFEVMYYTASAEVGIHIIENTCLNHYYCLPNKIFEYVFSGLPAIVSNFPEMSKVIDEGKCGWAIPVEKAALLKLVNNLSREEIAEKKLHALQYAAKFSWEYEEKKLQQIYRDLLASVRF